MVKVRVYELAKELNVQPKELLDLMKTIGVANKVPSSSIEDTTARSLRQMISNKNNPEAAAREAAAMTQAPASPKAFQNFRSGGRRFSTTPSTPPVAPSYSNGGSNGNGASNSNGTSSNGTSAPVIEEERPAPEAKTVEAPVAPKPVVEAPANDAPTTDGPSSGTVNNAATRASFSGATGFAPSAAPPSDEPIVVTPVSPSAPTVGTGTRPGSQRFGGRGDSRGRGGRDFRRGGRGPRDANGPRFGDKDFQVEAEEDSTTKGKGDKKILSIPPAITIAELAEKIGQPPATLIKRLFMMNILRSANQTVEADVAGQLIAPYGYQMEVEKPRQEIALEEELEGGDMVSVPAVVTVMGHVDHGKTSLLDIIRSANVQTGEAGGITQRIGAYETEHNGERIVFLDTPGHEAFTRMRARGAHVTDIAVLVVAADDGVMPQTREAIDHARAAKVPIIIAMNKMDRAEASPDRVKGELAEVGLIPEDYGGDTVIIPVSAKTGQGVQELLDMILLVAELQELKANQTGLAVGTVIEAQQDAQKGPVATVLVHRGTLHVGDHIVVGNVFGRVRAMNDYKGEAVQEAGPKKPVTVMGLSAVPYASDSLRAVESAKDAREQATTFGEEAKEGRFLGTARISLDELFAQVQKGGTKELNVIVKADVQGSVEAMVGSLEKLAHDEVRVKIISRGAGNVNESDVMLAAASGAIIIAFAVGVDPASIGLADREKVDVRSYSVIYDAINEIKGALEGMLEPVFEERLSGEADVRALFKSTKAGTIAGCLVQSGKLIQGSTLRVWRNTKRVFEGKIDSLKHVKQDVKEMVAGQECGVSANGFNDFEEGDILQSIVMQSVKRNIEARRPETAVVGPPQKRQ